jgi:hypothetical protein
VLSELQDDSEFKDKDDAWSSKRSTGCFLRSTLPIEQFTPPPLGMPSKLLPDHVPSPGNAFSLSGPDMPQMRMPHLEFIYRIVAEMDKGGVTEIKGVDSTSRTRVVLPIQGGYVNGPQIKGTIVEKSGADWAEVINPNKVQNLIGDDINIETNKQTQSFTRLNAMYTLQTDDNVYILVKAQGIYRTGPGIDEKAGEKDSVSQDEMEYFTHITFEAPGDSAYGWLNGVVAMGVMIMWQGRPVIDCYRLTNFPGRLAANL